MAPERARAGPRRNRPVALSPCSAKIRGNRPSAMVATPRSRRPGPGQLVLDEDLSRPRRYPAVYISLFAPAGRRRNWWFTYTCPYCRLGHFGWVTTQDEATGTHRAGCGRRVWRVVARIYRGDAE